MRLKYFLLSASLLTCTGAQPNITSPTLGYAYDAGSHAIRPVRGIPGALILGKSLRLGFVPTTAAVAPQQNYAIAVSANQGLRLIRWDTGSPIATALDSVISSPDRIVFSPSGSAAILFDSVSNRMQVVSGLPNSPMIRDIQTSPVTTFAIADDATVVRVTSDGAQAITSDLNTIPLPLPGDIAALSFNRSNDDLLAVTNSGDLYLATNVGANFAIRKIYTGDSRTSDPIGVHFSPDASAAFVINRAGFIASIDLNTESAGFLSCQCTPTALEPFGQASLFRINDISNRPLLLFDGTPNQNRVWFVPAETPRSVQ